MHAISELFELSRPFVTHTPHTATLLRLTIILVPTAVLLALAVPAAKRKSGNPLRGWLLGLFAGLSMLIIRLPFITVRAFGAGIAAVFGQQPSITAELGFPWNADLLALGLFWVAAVYAYFVDPHPSRRRTVTVSLLFGAMALDVLYGRYLQAWLDAAETAQYAENALGLHVDLLSVLFVLLNAAALALPLCSAFRSRKAAKKAVAAGRRTS